MPVQPPPVYRPNNAVPILPKMGPAVYKPQALQMKPARPAAPPVYKPICAQLKPAAQVAPPLFKPNHARPVLPAVMLPVRPVAQRSVPPANIPDLPSNSLRLRQFSAPPLTPAPPVPRFSPIPSHAPIAKPGGVPSAFAPAQASAVPSPYRPIPSPAQQAAGKSNMAASGYKEALRPPTVDSGISHRTGSRQHLDMGFRKNLSVPLFPSAANANSLQCMLGGRFNQLDSTSDRRLKARAKRMVKKLWKRAGNKYTKKNKLAVTYTGGDLAVRVTFIMASAGMDVVGGGKHATTTKLRKRKQSHTEGFAAVLSQHKPLIIRRINLRRQSRGLNPLPANTAPVLLSAISLRAPCNSKSGGTPQGCSQLPEDSFGNPGGAVFGFLKPNSNTPTELKALQEIGETNDENYDMAIESDDEEIDGEQLKGENLDFEQTFENAIVTGN